MLSISILSTYASYVPITDLYMIILRKRKVADVELSLGREQKKPVNNNFRPAFLINSEKKSAFMFNQDCTLMIFLERFHPVCLF